MKKLCCILSALSICFLLYSTAMSQSYLMKGRSSLELNIGLWGGTKVSNAIGSTGTQMDANATNFVGGLLFVYWFEERFPLTIETSLLSGEASSHVGTSGITQQTSSVVSLLLGTRYYIIDSTPEDRLRPYISGAIGTYIGSEAKNNLLSQEAHVERAIGGRLGVGTDLILGNHFKLGAGINYHLMADFASPVGARKNYNGAAFCLMLGVIF